MLTIRPREIAAAVMAVLAWAAPAARADDKALSSDDVLERTGKTIDEWGAAWWQWAFVTPGVLAIPLGNSDRRGTSEVLFSLQKDRAAVR